MNKKKRKNKSKQKWIDYKAGDIVAIPISIKKDEFAFARVLLDINKQCIEPKLLPENSPLKWHKDRILFEVYSKTSFDIDDYDTSKILIPGIFTVPGDIMMGTWKIVGYEKVNPEQVEFPENFSSAGMMTARFIRGEIVLHIPLEYEEQEKLAAHPTNHASVGFSWLILYYLNRKSEIFQLAKHELIYYMIWKEEYTEENMISARDLSSNDLRFSPNRTKVYELIKENKNLSYYELAKKNGFDLGRFYKPNP